MNFKFKSALQNLISIAPFSESINYLFQRYLQKSIPISNKEFIHKVILAKKHYENFIELNHVAEKENKYYEFGAGIDLIIPLAIMYLGFEVHCTDVKKLVRLNILADSLQKFISNKNAFPFDFKEKFLQPNGIAGIFAELEKEFSFKYSANVDAGSTNFNNETFEFISSTYTMEHIPSNDIGPILNECHRILKKGGVFSMLIDYKDHWSYFDKNISCYNFLQYSDDKWQKYNSSLQYQNRLRHIDYLKIIEKTEFKLVKCEHKAPTTKELEQLANLTLAKKFQNYSIEELAIKSSEIVLIKV